MILPVRRSIMCGATWRDHQIRPAHIHRHDAVPGVGVPLVEIARLERRIERGIVDQDVDLAEALDGLRHQVLDRLFVADVELDAGHRIGAMAAGDFLGQLLAVGDVGDHHARAFGGERLRIMPADALGAAGDDRGFSRKPGHASSSLSSPEPCSGHPQLRISLGKRDKGRKQNHAARHRRPAGDPRAGRELGAVARRPHVGPLPHRLAQGRPDVGDLVPGHLRGIHQGQARKATTAACAFMHFLGGIHASTSRASAPSPRPR